MYSFIHPSIFRLLIQFSHTKQQLLTRVLFLLESEVPSSWLLFDFCIYESEGDNQTQKINGAAEAVSSHWSF
jgi:hypothetical protein